MTESEAIRLLQNIIHVSDNSDECNNVEIDAFHQDAIELAIKALEEIQAHRAIGTIEEFKALKEKAEPKKAIGKREYNEAYCPCCNEVISDGEFWALNEYVHHCNECGQAVKGVDWQ